MRVKCINDSTVKPWITVGIEYDVIEEIDKTFYKIKCDNGVVNRLYQHRFEIIKEENNMKKPIIEVINKEVTEENIFFMGNVVKNTATQAIVLVHAEGTNQFSGTVLASGTNSSGTVGAYYNAYSKINFEQFEGEIKITV